MSLIANACGCIVHVCQLEALHKDLKVDKWDISNLVPDKLIYSAVVHKLLSIIPRINYMRKTYCTYLFTGLKEISTFSFPNAQYVTEVTSSSS
jgi:hypothetical protein